MSELAEMLGKRLFRVAQLSDLSMSKSVAAYVIGVLCGFIRSKKFFRVRQVEGRNVLAFEYLVDLFLEALEDSRTSSAKYKRMGDVALVTSGFFRERIARRRELNYYHSMGSAAYMRMAKIQPLRVYAELSLMFKEISDVLYNAWIFRDTYTEEDLLRLYRCWLKTKDDILKRELLAQGFCPEAFLVAADA